MVCWNIRDIFYLYSGWVLYAGYSLHTQNFIRSIYWNTRGGIVKPSGRNCIYLDSSRMFLICTYWKKIVTCPDTKGADKKKAYRNLFMGKRILDFTFGTGTINCRIPFFRRYFFIGACLFYRLFRLFFSQHFLYMY